MLQVTFELDAPFPVDSVIWGDVVLADSPDPELLLEAWKNPSLSARSADPILSLRSTELLGSHQLRRQFRQYLMYNNNAIEVAHICSYNCSASRSPLMAMNQDGTSLRNCPVDESARVGEVDEEINVVEVFDRNPQVFDPTSGLVGWDRVQADGHDVSDPPIRYGSRSASSSQTTSEADEAR